MGRGILRMATENDHIDSGMAWRASQEPQMTQMLQIQLLMT